MKLVFFSFLLSLCMNISASSLDSLKFENNTLFYHKLDSDKAQKKGLVIFLHGGVSQFMGLEKSKKPSAEYLVEHNTQFIPEFHNEGYDVVLPISFNQYNWLEDEGEQFILELVSKFSEKYDRIYISGFSDGGSGSYRIFYKNPGLFAGLMTFNGYPQLKNAFKKVDYRTVTNKKIIFLGTIQDKKIPYEFMMIEFRRQQMVNKHSYFLLTKGVHSFTSYKQTHFKKCISIFKLENIKENIGADSIMIYPPIDGLIENNKIIEVYQFRKKSVAKYGVKSAEHTREDIDWKWINLKIKKGADLVIIPKIILKKDLNSAKKFNFFIEEGHISWKYELNNWFTTSSW